MKGSNRYSRQHLRWKLCESCSVLACQEDVFRVEDPLLIFIADESRAHFYACAVRDVCVRLPDEDPKAKQPGVCVGNFERRCTDLWTQPNDGESITLKFWRLEGFPEAWHLQTYILMHGHDFFIVGRQEVRKHALSLLRVACELSKVLTLGSRSQSRIASFLGGTLTLRQWGIEYEPDQHVSRALEALGLTDSKGVATPGTDDVGGPKTSKISELRRTAKWHDTPKEVREEDLLTQQELVFQSVAARFDYLAMDRPDPLYSVKELMRKKWIHHAHQTSLSS